MTVRSLWQVTFLGALALFSYGCGSSGINIRTYAEDRPRVDQEISGMGNAGYIGGSMQASTLAERKTTRKVYVMEVSKGSGNIKPLEDEETGAGTPRDQSAGQEPGTTRSIQYTVEKDDTLQKIAKKFYDSYSKWTRIYEANKSVIPDPDRIKPGTVLQIPVD
ncbi:MAG TPA: hypothetical protein DE315_06255 [Candidatus Omnitrophica bacterium]|nr:hypothetical protein [Candidatus Omnitrophota bacterium]HCI45112.1 hypothetical protein [Candidatus Omnitrophota bacterium]